jgi:RHS repeat-associated protein
VFGGDGLVGRTGAANVYYVFDQQGNVAQRLNSSQSVTSSSTYDAYGAETTTGSPSDPFGYNAKWGYYFDREAGIYKCTFRDYDPSTGRWLTRDSISYNGGVNLYGYCLQRPPNLLDFTGTSGFFEYIGDVWEGAVYWCKGVDVTDDNGNPVRVGGWPALFNPKRNAITVNGTTHINDADDYELYINDEHWQRHENRHLEQDREMGRGWFNFEICREYVVFGHDNAPLERDADNARGDMPWKDPWSGTPWYWPWEAR